MQVGCGEPISGGAHIGTCDAPPLARTWSPSNGKHFVASAAKLRNERSHSGSGEECSR